MPNLLQLKIFNLTLVFWAAVGIAATKPATTETEVALGWSKNAVNAVVFRKNSVVSHAGMQYTAFYDTAGYMVLAKRPLKSKKWEVQRTDYQGNVKDAHNSISIMVDGDGYLHVSWDHHNNQLRYSRSAAPGSLALLPKMPMTGQDEARVTYPEFYRLPTGDLLFIYRNGASGNGDLVLNRYSRKEKKWSRLHNVLIDGEKLRNAYWQAFVDAKGTIHVSWVWRESPDVASNHDIAYARSVDGGKTWQKATGEKYVLPIKEATAEYAVKIPQQSELINSTSMYADAQGRPYIATYYRPAGSPVPQYHLVYHDGSKWQTQQISNRQTAFSLSGSGTKKIPISRPQIMVNQIGSKTGAYMLFRDEERGSKVSLGICKDLAVKKWEVKDLTADAVGNWEPSYDTELWRNSGLLHVFVQKVGQGDGEKLENIKPQMVRILEWKP
ncbi:BNR repeat-containing protein [Adhaeribacter rhizoryzae]|uniref:Neuraminidase n=1 Tax=Adhaeribacter rhizoryzae TaxID=2607907 RepID=A0A5M6DNZ9_9BACT|nr:BNR repeat-containing protein [Adhaeribacter rhizoryzae]KAA5549153.1 neuraminidase [Adhaeribacter rhizoryzae]